MTGATHPAFNRVRLLVEIRSGGIPGASGTPPSGGRLETSRSLLIARSLSARAHRARRIALDTSTTKQQSCYTTPPCWIMRLARRFVRAVKPVDERKAGHRTCQGGMPPIDQLPSPGRVMVTSAMGKMSRRARRAARSASLATFSSAYVTRQNKPNARAPMRIHPMVTGNPLLDAAITDGQPAFVRFNSSICLETHQTDDFVPAAANRSEFRRHRYPVSRADAKQGTSGIGAVAPD